MTVSTDVLRFVSRRPPRRLARDAMARVAIPPTPPRSGLGTHLPANAEPLTQEQLRKWAAEFVTDPAFVADPANLDTPVAAVDEWLAGRGDAAPGSDVIDEVRRLTGGAVGDLVGSQQYGTDRSRVMASLVASIVLPAGRERLRAALLRMMYVFGLLERIAADKSAFPRAQDVHDFLLNATVLLPSALPMPADGLARTPAVAELKVVRQELVRYELGEIAHIENVLKGESKERTHSASTVREETTVVESEREETHEQDLVSTDRFELQRETQSVVAEDSHFEAGVTVSGSYGTVSATASAAYETNHSAEASTRVASTFANDVTQRAASRIRERVREERTVRVRTEVSDVDKHAVDNATGDEHVVGVYRWVDKVYRAQVYTYGKRLLLEFIVPEPASFVRLAADNAATPTVTTTKPAEPVVAEAGGTRPLRPSDLTATTYQRWIGEYFVRDAQPPPEQTRWLSLGLEDPAKPDNGIGATTPGRKLYKVNRELAVPAGYHASRVTGTLHVSDFVENVFLTVGATNVALTEFDRGTVEAFSVALEFDTSLTEANTGTLPVALLIDNAWGYGLALMLECTLDAAGLAAWQQKTYEQIMSAYFELKGAYDAEVSAAQARAGIQISGRNPADNRRIEREELKKGVVALLQQHHFDQPPVDGDAVFSAADGLPEIDFGVAAVERDYIQWFEQAFEWPQLTYVFYPYFWAQRTGWSQDTNRSDPDPLFAAFLRAGAARVVVPVRPGFEAAIALYLSTGLIWSGSQVPQVSDPLYVSLIQEIVEQQGQTAAVPEGDPWEVRLPTTLVMLQEDGTLPVP